MNNSLQDSSRDAVLSLVRSGRVPHTVIIEGSNEAERQQAAMLLAQGAICQNDNPPCQSCNACTKVAEGIHPDVFIPEPSKQLKSGILSLKDLRDDYLSQMSIKPNEADIKIYIFKEADRLLREDSQNALLKTIEEPPQRLLFIFTVQSAKSLLMTVRSRAVVITLRHNEGLDEEAKEKAEGLIDGIVGDYEYNLLCRLSAITDKDGLKATLTLLNEKLRQALSFYSGIMTNDVYVKKLCRKLDRGRTLALIETNNEALKKLNTNVNLQLLTMWLSSQYRRITWQK